MAKTKKEYVARFLADAEPARCFWCSDGKIVCNLADLPEALQNMSDETFNYHASNEKNDFCNWVHDVIGDKNLAANLKKIKNRIVAAKKIKERVEYLRYLNRID
ncbi:hypothetical protein HYV50_01780 [Candidatus Pacearchaeota archaeon]|nr:hypothetical protein [Candidatus Pacearchaeota archaeon]